MSGAILLFSGCNSQKQIEKDRPQISVKFSPNGGITQSIVDTVLEAKDTIKVQAFSFTSLSIAEALIAAKTRGVDVQVVLDRENLFNKSSVIKTLYNSGITIYIDDQHTIAHNKVIIIDRCLVFTGSFNFSRNAETKNAENSVLINDRQITTQFIENWILHKEHSYIYNAE